MLHENILLRFRPDGGELMSAGCRSFSIINSMTSTNDRIVRPARAIAAGPAFRIAACFRRE
jgi:hypothetical protein